jgi:hypothetical protein
MDIESRSYRPVAPRSGNLATRANLRLSEQRERELQIFLPSFALLLCVFLVLYYVVLVSRSASSFVVQPVTAAVHDETPSTSAKANAVLHLRGRDLSRVVLHEVHTLFDECEVGISGCADA